MGPREIQKPPTVDGISNEIAGAQEAPGRVLLPTQLYNDGLSSIGVEVGFVVDEDGEVVAVPRVIPCES